MSKTKSPETDWLAGAADTVQAAQVMLAQAADEDVAALNFNIRDDPDVAESRHVEAEAKVRVETIQAELRACPTLSDYEAQRARALKLVGAKDNADRELLEKLAHSELVGEIQQKLDDAKEALQLAQKRTGDAVDAASRRVCEANLSAYRSSLAMIARCARLIRGAIQIESAIIGAAKRAGVQVTYLQPAYFQDVYHPRVQQALETWSGAARD